MLKTILKKIRRFISRRKPGGLTTEFTGSRSYWESRYENGGNSGAGSYGHLAEYKAGFLNEFVKTRGVATLIEFGSGDGNQLKLADYPDYTGVDVSQTCIEACINEFAEDQTKRFLNLDGYKGETAEVSLSLDVVYHLVEDEVFESYMATVFDAATKYVIVYASNRDGAPGETAKHVRHRKFSDWIAENRNGWVLELHEENPHTYDPENNKGGSFADFFVYKPSKVL